MQAEQALAKIEAAAKSAKSNDKDKSDQGKSYSRYRARGME
jgi:hypothetical protein